MFRDLKTFYDKYPKEKASSNSINLWRWLVINPFSIFVAYIFSLLKLKPNFVTLLSLIFGLYSIYNFLNSHFIYGALILNFSYLLDCVDGHLARFYSKTSKKGQFLDDISGIIVWSITWFAIGIGLWNKNQDGSLNIIFLDYFNITLNNIFLIIFGAVACIFSELRTLISFKFIQVNNSNKSDPFKVNTQRKNLSILYLLFRNITGIGGFILPLILFSAFLNVLDLLIFNYSIIYFITFVFYCIRYYNRLE
jgi:phosphatidylglycerophosphate synthase